MNKKLIIFDIDQTLVEVLKFHNKALDKTLREVYGVGGSFFDIDFPGTTIKWCIAEVAQLKGVKRAIVGRKIKKAVNAYQKNFVRIIPKNSDKYLLPGVKNLLKSLTKKEYILAVVTGNARQTGTKILKSTGLYNYFKVFVFGGMAKKRKDLVGVALKKAKNITEHNFKGKDVMIIGDSIKDVKSGKPYRAKTIAVLTGYHSRQKLMKAKPDYIFKNLKNTKKVLEAISG